MSKLKFDFCIEIESDNSLYDFRHSLENLPISVNGKIVGKISKLVGVVGGKDGSTICCKAELNDKYKVLGMYFENCGKEEASHLHKICVIKDIPDDNEKIEEGNNEVTS